MERNSATCSYLDLEYYSLSLSGTNDVLALISGTLQEENNII